MVGMKCFIGTRATNGNARDALFRVSTLAGYAFMCVSSTNYQNEARAVVEVDCAQFLALWLRESPFWMVLSVLSGLLRTKRKAFQSSAMSTKPMLFKPSQAFRAAAG